MILKKCIYIFVCAFQKRSHEWKVSFLPAALNFACSSSCASNFQTLYFKTHNQLPLFVFCVPNQCNLHVWYTQSRLRTVGRSDFHVSFTRFSPIFSFTLWKTGRHVESLVNQRTSVDKKVSFSCVFRITIKVSLWNAAQTKITAMETFILLCRLSSRLVSVSSDVVIVIWCSSNK